MDDDRHHSGKISYLAVRRGLGSPGPTSMPARSVRAAHAGHRERGVRRDQPEVPDLAYRAGQPLHPRTLLPLIHQLGIPAQATRVAALRQLVLQASAPVIADALGYHNKHVAKVWTETGGTWKTYAPGDHSK